MNKFACAFLNVCILLSLYSLDRWLGSGFLKLFNRVLCTFVCFVRKSLKEEMKEQEEFEQSVDLPVLALEMLVLSFSMVILNQCKRFPRLDRIDELMRKSKDSLRHTTECLEKWRERSMSKEYSYLDEEPQEVLSPMNLEIPILQLAIIDHRGTTKMNPGTGDAGEPIDIVDSTVLSVTSLIDGATYDSIGNAEGDHNMAPNHLDYNHRLLWDVMEEDSSCS